MAELWALRDGLVVARDLGLHSLIVELDAKVIVDLLSGGQLVNLKLMPFILDCRNLCQSFRRIWIQQTYREANNGVADCMAQRARNS